MKSLGFHPGIAVQDGDSWAEASAKLLVTAAMARGDFLGALGPWHFSWRGYIIYHLYIVYICVYLVCVYMLVYGLRINHQDNGMTMCDRLMLSYFLMS